MKAKTKKAKKEKYKHLLKIEKIIRKTAKQSSINSSGANLNRNNFYKMISKTPFDENERKINMHQQLKKQRKIYVKEFKTPINKLVKRNIKIENKLKVSSNRLFQKSKIKQINKKENYKKYLQNIQESNLKIDKINNRKNSKILEHTNQFLLNIYSKKSKQDFKDKKLLLNKGELIARNKKEIKDFTIELINIRLQENNETKIKRKKITRHTLREINKNIKQDLKGVQ